MAAFAAIFVGVKFASLAGVRTYIMEQVLNAISAIRFNAMNLLAMREHSAKELRVKLERKFTCSESIDAAINSLVEQGLQSDERFAQAFVAMRQRQGKGVMIIRLELREKGVAAELISNCIDDDDVVWSELVREVWYKKYRGVFPNDARERAKQMRFLHSRGFTSKQIKSVFEAEVDDQ